MLNTLTILLVDDDEDFVEIIARRLAQRGAVTTVSSEAAGALETLLDDEPDIVILDRKIGNEDGVELARRMRAIEPQLPIIMLSGYSDEASIAEALDAGVTRYLTKPLSLVQMETAVAEMASGSGLLSCNG